MIYLTGYLLHEDRSYYRVCLIEGHVLHEAYLTDGHVLQEYMYYEWTCIIERYDF